MINLIVRASNNWLDYQSPRLGAALAYYAVFSLGLLLIVVSVAGLFYDRDAVTNAIGMQCTSLIGANGAKALEAMREGAASTSLGKTTSILGLPADHRGSWRRVAQLKDALNVIWEVDSPGARGW